MKIKNTGLTIIETLVVTLVTASLLGIIFSVFLVGRNSWAKSETYIDLQEKTRLSMDKMVREISLSSAVLPDGSDGVTIGDCPHPEYNCYGNYVEFKMPVATDDSIFNSDGDIKFGAENQEGWTIKYLVSQGGPNDRRLVRVVPSAPIPTGACCNGGTCTIMIMETCENGGGTYNGDDSLCSPNPCSGACCTGTTCLPNRTAEECAAEGSEAAFHGNGTVCSPNPCGGACCEGTSCSFTTAWDCASAGGTFKGAGITCNNSTCGDGCFLAGTPILMADGLTKPIEEIKPEDLIMAFDEATGELKEDKVTEFFEHDSDEYLIINDNLRVTEHHPVYSNGEWIKIGKLKVGDMLSNPEGKPEKIMTIKKVLEPVKVYNLEVNPYHTYIAGGYIVHNKPDVGDGGRLEFGCLKQFFSETLAFADEISILSSDIKNLTIVNPNDPSAPNIIEITITAERKTMLGETIEVVVKSRVYLRN